MKRKGISLITLIITIVVIIILSTAIILNIKDENVIDNARKAQIGQTLDTFKNELTLEISDKFFEDTSLKISNIDSRDEEGWRIIDLVPSIKGTEYENELIVINGKLKLKKDSSFPEEKQKVIIEFLGPIEEDNEPDDNDENEEIIPGQNAYQITYDLNGGNGTFNAQTKIEGEALKISSTVPIRLGYTFNNWKATDGTLYELGAIYEKDESTVLTAQWTVNKYTLTFDSNGGSCTTTSISENYGTEITLPTPTKEGYTFNGWYTAVTSGEKVTYTTMPSKSQTLYAQWTVNKYTLTFNANGGSCSTTSISENYGTEITLPIPTREGYTFNGWYTSATSGDKVTYTTMPSKSQTLYAQWTVNKYTLTFNANGGSCSTTSISENYGTEITLPIPTREGYTFNGWYTAVTSGDKVTYTTMPSKSETLYAQWTVNKYTLTFNANGGSVDVASISENYGTEITLPTPTREGYTFNGWYTSASDGEKIEYTTMPSKSQTLYAIWKEKIGNVIYVTSGNIDNPGQYELYVSSGGGSTGSSDTKTANILIPKGSTVYYTITATASDSSSAAGKANIGSVAEVQVGSSTQTSGTATKTNSFTVSEDTLYTLTVFGGGGPSQNGTGRVNISKVLNSNGEQCTFEISNIYTISYNANKGSDAPNIQYKIKDKNITLSTTVPTRTNFKFKGWGTSSTDLTATYQSGSTYSNNANVILYAIWETIDPLRTIYFSSGTFDSSGQYELYVSSGGGSTGSSDTKTAKVFIPKGSKVYYTITATTNSASAASYATIGNVETVQSGSYTETSGTATKTNSFTASEDTLYTLTVFGGGGPNQNGTGKVKITQILNSNGEQCILEVEELYTISYNANKGSNGLNNQYKVRGKDIILSTTVPTRTNFTFKGWGTSSTATTATYQPGSVYASDKNITLYAIWETIDPSRTIVFSNGVSSGNSTATLPANVKVYYTLSTYTGGTGGGGSSISFAGVTKDSISTPTTTKSGSFTTTTSGTLQLSGSGGNGGGGSVTITRIVGTDGTEYILD